jgi:kynureninase
VIDPLLEYHDRFPILSHTNYLISNSLGAAPRDADDALQDPPPDLVFA